MRKFYLFSAFIRKEAFEDGYAFRDSHFRLGYQGVQYNQKLPLQSEPLFDSRAHMDLSRAADAGWLTDTLVSLRTALLNEGVFSSPSFSSFASFVTSLFFLPPFSPTDFVLLPHSFPTSPLFSCHSAVSHCLSLSISP